MLLNISYANSSFSHSLMFGLIVIDDDVGTVEKNSIVYAKGVFATNKLSLKKIKMYMKENKVFKFSTKFMDERPDLSSTEIEDVEYEWLNDKYYQIKQIKNSFHEFSYLHVEHNDFFNNNMPSGVIYGIAKNKEEAMLDVSKKIQDVLQKMPYPVMFGWVDYIVNNLDPVKLKTVPASADVYAYKVKIPEAVALETLISNAYADNLWKSNFKNGGPRKQYIRNAIFNIETFNVKTFQNFVAGLKQARIDLDSLSYEIQESLINLYELVGDQNAIKYIKLFGTNVWHKASIRFILYKLKIEQEGFKDVDIFITTILNILANVKKSSELEDVEFESMFIASIENIEKIKAQIELLGKKPKYADIKAILLNLEYEDVRYPGIAMVCARAKVSEAEFHIYQNWWEANAKKRESCALAYPTLKGTLSSNPEYQWEMCDPSDYNILVAGNETNCCQHPTSVGGDCVDYMLKNPETSTIFRVTKKGKTIAQSFVWRENSRDGIGKNLCCDNIEALGDEIRKDIYNCYLEYAKEAEKAFISLGIKHFTVGARYSDVLVNNLPKAEAASKAKVPSSLGYSDARGTQYIIKLVLSDDEKARLSNAIGKSA